MKRILVAVSFGPQSDAALKYARKIAGETGGTVSCLYVVEEPGFITRSFISGEVQEKITRKAEQALFSKVHAIYGQEEVPYETIVTRGKVYRVILDQAADLEADLIVLGRSDVIDLNKEGLGTNASLVMARSDIPVCCVKNSAQLQNGTALLPLDLTGSVGLKITKTIEMATLFHWKVQLCTILPSAIQGKEAPFRDRLKEIQKLMAEHDVPSTIQLIYSDRTVPEEILSLAENGKAGQIILMTQHEDSEGEPFVGATTRNILHKSALTVFSLTPDTHTALYTVKKQTEFLDHPIHLQV